jgi:hypothetical protein
MIWKASFPRRRGVCLATPLTLHNKGAQRQYPIALHINRESRQTVLEHYIILSHYIKERLLWNTLSVLPLCFDPVRDSLYVRIRPMFYSELKDVAQILLEKAPGHFNKITKLEIHIAPHKGCLWSWSSWFHGILAMHNGRDMMVGMLKFFQKLEFVQLVVPLEFQDLLYRSALRYFPWDSVWEKEKYRVQVLEFFEALKRDNPAYKIPKIEL